MSLQTVLPPGQKEAFHGLEDHVRTLLDTLDFTVASEIYHSFDDHFALGTAIRGAIEETPGTDRTFEDGVRQSWSPTRDEELAFTRFLTEYESVFWSIRREVLRCHIDAAFTLDIGSVQNSLVALDREVRGEILARIQAVQSLVPG